MRVVATAALLIAVVAAFAVAEDDATPRRATPHHPGGIAWDESLAVAQAAAAEDGRPVIAYFTFDT